MKEKWCYMQCPNDGHVHRTTRPEFWKERTLLERKHGEAMYLAQERKELIASLHSASRAQYEQRKLVTVYVIKRSVSSSGMQKTVDLYLMQDYGMQKITKRVADAAKLPLNKREELVLRGCNTDVVMDLVGELWYALRLTESLTFNTYVL